MYVWPTHISCHFTSWSYITLSAESQKRGNQVNNMRHNIYYLLTKRFRILLLSKDSGSSMKDFERLEAIWKCILLERRYLSVSFATQLALQKIVFWACLWQEFNLKSSFGETGDLRPTCQVLRHWLKYNWSG